MGGGLGEAVEKMKRGTHENPKVAELARLLNIDLWGAVGILEMLWHFTAKFAPRGDVGRHSDATIANFIRWSKHSGSRGVTSELWLSSSLVRAELLDSCSCHRLVVHDWPEHADQSVRKFLSRHGLDFVHTADSLPEPEPVPRPASMDKPPEREQTSTATGAPNGGKAVALAPAFDVEGLFRELRAIYHRAGCPIAPKHEQLARQLVLSLEAEARGRVARRLPDYCKWALVTGRWKNAATTKSLLNVLRDGDWDVELSERDLPSAPRQETMVERKTREYLERHHGKGHNA